LSILIFTETNYFVNPVKGLLKKLQAGKELERSFPANLFLKLKKLFVITSWLL